MSQSSHTPWLPRVGDRVRVKGAGISGVVAEIVGEGRARQFILDRDPLASDAGPGTSSAADEDEERHAFAVSELEPDR